MRRLAVGVKGSVRRVSVVVCCYLIDRDCHSLSGLHLLGFHLVQMGKMQGGAMPSAWGALSGILPGKVLGWGLYLGGWAFLFFVGTLTFGLFLISVRLALLGSTTEPRNNFFSLSPFHPATLEKGPDSDEATCLRNQLWKSPSSFSRRSDLVLKPPVDQSCPLCRPGPAADEAVAADGHQ